MPFVQKKKMVKKPQIIKKPQKHRPTYPNFFEHVTPNT